MPPEFVIVTPVQLLAAYGIWLLMVFAAIGIGWWLAGADRSEPVVGNDPGSVTTVEIPAEGRSRGRSRPPRTGTIHAAHLAPDESPTQVIRRPEVRS